MTRALPLFRPGLLAAAISLASVCTPALADTYQLPAAPLASTLTQIASQAGIVLSIDPALTVGKQSAPVHGDYDALEALHQALRGSGLQLQHGSAGVYSLIPAPQATVALPDITVTASQQTESAGPCVRLPGLTHRRWQQNRHSPGRGPALDLGGHPRTDAGPWRAQPR